MLHFGRSGTGLLHSLLDSHPEVSTLPSIYLRGFFNAGVWNKISADGWRRLPERFADEFAVLFDANSPRPTPGMVGENSSLLGRKRRNDHCWGEPQRVTVPGPGPVLRRGPSLDGELHERGSSVISSRRPRSV